MANPQKENGYTPIANEILDALYSFRIPGELRQVFDFILRKTYGFNKKCDSISNSQISEGCKLGKQNVSRSLSKLLKHGLVIKVDYSKVTGHCLGINKDYTEWRPFVIRTDYSHNSLESSELITRVIRTDYSSNQDGLQKLSSLTDTKDKIQLKDTLKTVGRKKVAKAPVPRDETKMFFEGVKDLLEKKSVPWLSELLSGLSENNPTVSKAKIWVEVVNFCSYWTESTHDGRKEKWQTQKTFEVWRRIKTWFNRANFKDFQSGGQIKNKGRGLVE